MHVYKALPIGDPKTLKPPSHTLRTALIDNEPRFVAADVCRALDLRMDGGTTLHMAVLKPDQKKSALGALFATLPGSGAKRGGLRASTKINIVNEAGLYRLIMRSDKPEAQEFQHCVTAEVLPSIRKTGKYDLADHGQRPPPQA